VTDLDDWQRALDGDGEAFGRIFDAHRDRVFRHSLRLVGSWADADDVVATVFLECWRRRASVRVVDGSLLPWLLVTATNVSRNLTRSSRRYRALLDRLPPPVPAPDYELEESTALDALRNLSRQHQQVLVLCVLEGYLEADAARALGVPVGTVKSRLARARRRLGQQLNGDGRVGPELERRSHERPQPGG
jgi:RNA polymerase sigma factor (sigma-70 family)